MNNGNAVGFVGVGAAMWLLPFLVPAWFPHVAVDGSSTRAIWVQAMGLVELAIGATYLARHWAAPAFGRWLAALPRGAVSSADWLPEGRPENVIAVDFAFAAQGSVDERPDGAIAAVGPRRKFRDAELRFLRRLAQLRRSMQRGPSASAGMVALYGPREALVNLVQASLTDLHRLYSMNPDEFDEYALAMLGDLLSGGSTGSARQGAGEAA